MPAAPRVSAVNLQTAPRGDAAPLGQETAHGILVVIALLVADAADSYFRHIASDFACADDEARFVNLQAPGRRVVALGPGASGCLALAVEKRERAWPLGRSFGHHR